MAATIATLTRSRTWRPGSYLRTIGVLPVWLALWAITQTTLFILVARTLGPQGYGARIAVLTLAGIFSFVAMRPTPPLHPAPLAR